VASFELRLDAPEPETFHASSLEELDELMGNLHDYPFDLDQVEFDKAAGTWKGTFFRPLHQAPDVERRRFALVFWRWRMPVVRALVCVKGVADVRILADQGIGRYSFNEVRPTNEGVCFRFNEALEIEFDLVRGIDVTYDEELMPEARAVVRSFLLAETGPEIVDVVDHN
jgi:hypothetical protein